MAAMRRECGAGCWGRAVSEIRDPCGLTSCQYTLARYYWFQVSGSSVCLGLEIGFMRKERLRFLDYLYCFWVQAGDVYVYHDLSIAAFLSATILNNIYIYICR